MHVIFSCAPNKYQRQRISRKESAAEETRKLDGGDIMLPLAVSAADRRGCKYQTHNCIYVVYLSYHCSVGNQWNFFEYFFLQKNPQSYQNDMPNKGSLMRDSPTPHHPTPSDGKRWQKWAKLKKGPKILLFWPLMLCIPMAKGNILYPHFYFYVILFD